MVLLLLYKYKNVIFLIVLFEHISFCVNIIYTKGVRKTWEMNIER